MQSPHTTCPGCQEEVFLDELVGGKCPLCGCSLEDFDESFGEYEGILDRSDLSWLIFNYFVFKKFVDLGVSSPPDHGVCCNLRTECGETSRRVDKNGVHTRNPYEPVGSDQTQALLKVQKIIFPGRKKTIRGDMRNTHLTSEYLCDWC